jgi:uncharacterized membrane protein YdbT with pleckstrin-like domain
MLAADGVGPVSGVWRDRLVSYVQRHLLPNERVIYKTRVHWILFVRPAFMTLVGLAVTVALGALTRTEWVWYLSLLVIVAGLVWVGVRAVELLTSEFAVTTTRLIFKVGIVARYTTELLLGKVESIGVQQKLLGRLLNYGDLVVTGTGGVREVFPRVHDPIAFRNHVQEASIRAFEPERGQ